MDVPTPPQTQQTEVQLLIEKAPIDKPDELEKEWRKQYLLLQSLFTENANGVITVKREQEINKILLTEASDTKRYNDVMLGLLYGLLSNEEMGEKYLQYMHWVVRDKFAGCASQLKKLTEKYRKLTEVCRVQLLWVTGKFLEEEAAQFVDVLSGLLRQIITGNISKENLWLIEQLVDLCTKHIKYLNLGELIPITFLTFSSIIPDHLDPSFNELKGKEIQLCTRLFYEKFSAIIRIGRDLLRIIEICARKKVVEFETLYNEMLSNPSRFSGELTEIWNLLRVRTPRIYVASRVTPEMEQWLLFIMKHINLGAERRYEEWFRERYLTTDLSENLIPDLIRFIVCCFHPDNRMLNSELVPRWIIIGWLLKCCRTKETTENAQLALFYDFLYFDSQADKIMNIEPAMLLLVKSIPKYTEISASLVEFLFRQIDKHEGELKNKVKQSINTSLATCVRMGVVPSLAPLVQCDAFDISIRNKLTDPLSPFFPFIPKDTILPIQQIPQQPQQPQPPQLQQSQQPSVPPVSLQNSPQNIPPLSATAIPNQQTPTVRPPPRTANGPQRTTAVKVQQQPKVQNKAPPVRQDSGGSRGILPSVKTGPPPPMKQEGGNPIEQLMKQEVPSTQPSSTLPHGRSKLKRSLLQNVNNNLKRPHDETTTDVTATKKQRITIDTNEDDNDALNLLWVGLDTTTQSITSESTAPSPLMISGVSTFSENKSGIFTSIFGSLLKQLRQVLGLSTGEEPSRARGVVEKILSTLKDHVTGTENSNEELLTVISDLALYFVESLFDEIKDTKSGVLLDKNYVKKLVYTKIFDFYVQFYTKKGQKKEENSNDTKNIKKNVLNTINQLMTEIQKLEPSWGFRFISYLVVGGDIYIPSVPEISPLSTPQRAKMETEDDSDEDFVPVQDDSDPDKLVYDMLMKRFSEEIDAESIFGPYLSWLEFRKNITNDTPKALFVTDVQNCAETDIVLFLELVPILFKNFNMFSVGNVEIVSLVCSLVYPTKLHNICCRLIMEEFEIIGSEALSSILVESLKWESFEQYCFWQLIDAEFSQNNIDIEENIPPFIENHIDPSQHSEALHGMMVLLSSISPTKQLIDMLLNLPLSFSRFTSLMIARWSNIPNGGEKELAAQLMASLAAIMPKRRGKAGKKNVQNARHVLRHLSLLRVFQESMLFETTINDEDSLFNQEKILKYIRGIIERNTLQNEFPKLYALTETTETGDAE